MLFKQQLPLKRRFSSWNPGIMPASFNETKLHRPPENALQITRLRWYLRNSKLSETRLKHTTSMISHHSNPLCLFSSYIDKTKCPGCTLRWQILLWLYCILTAKSPIHFAFSLVLCRGKQYYRSINNMLVKLRVQSQRKGNHCYYTKRFM